MRGRPRMTEEAAALEAAKIINVAWALRYRPKALPALGFTSETKALRYVSKRRRGRVAELVGESVREIYPAINKVQVAVSLVLDHGMVRHRAALLAGVAPINLNRAIIDGRRKRESAEARVQKMNGEVLSLDTFFVPGDPA